MPHPPRQLATVPLFFRGAEQVVTLAGPPAPRRGSELGTLAIVEDGGVLVVNGRITAVERSRSLESASRNIKARTIECRGRVVMPGFVDSHTHLVFAGDRVQDYERRLEGMGYEEIARAGGGILHTARLVAAATPETLRVQAFGFLSQFAAYGTTTVEVKTGYGLTVENEVKMLRVIRSLARPAGSAPKGVELVPTLLALHALPEKFRNRRKAYVGDIVRRLIPFAARHKLAESIDCFCECGAFTPLECRNVLAAGAVQGFIPRLHAEQLAHMGGTRLAIELGAASADHLDYLTASEIRALARSNTVATLLPGSNFHLGLRRFAPARRLIEAGAAIALATDFNPGTSPTLNMQFILTLACSALGLTPAEAVTAATLNAAYSLRRAHRLGSLEPGKEADLVVMDVDDYRKIPYYFAANHCVLTVKSGRIIYAREESAGGA
jgi:imidazolonepropionase